MLKPHFVNEEKENIKNSCTNGQPLKAYKASPEGLSRIRGTKARRIPGGGELMPGWLNEATDSSKRPAQPRLRFHHSDRSLPLSLGGGGGGGQWPPVAWHHVALRSAAPEKTRSMLVFAVIASGGRRFPSRYNRVTSFPRHTGWDWGAGGLWHVAPPQTNPLPTRNRGHFLTSFP